MRKFKLCKRIIAFLLVLTLVLSGNTQFVFADTVNNGANEVDTSDDGITYFKANLFDYDRDKINQKIMDNVAQAIQSDIDSGEVDGDILENKAEIRRRYPSMLFISVSNPGSSFSEYTYTDAETGEDKTGKVEAKIFKNFSEGYCLFNKNNSGKKIGTTYQGLVKNNLENDLPVFKVYNTDLFDVSDSSNKIVYANTDVQFESTPDGYYLFDSCVNKYRLEDGKVKIKEKDNTKTGQGYGFVPFGEDNYHFGMNLSIDFQMAEDIMVMIVFSSFQEMMMYGYLLMENLLLNLVECML